MASRRALQKVVAYAWKTLMCRRVENPEPRIQTVDGEEFLRIASQHFVANLAIR